MKKEFSFIFEPMVFKFIYTRFIVMFFILFSFSSFAQDLSTCDGVRYRSSVFDEVEVIRGVKFGEGTTFGGRNQELFMDIYTPKGDEETARPVVLLAFGGSFISGDRIDLQDICTDFAEKGYVAVAMDYRLYDGPFFPLPAARQFIDVVVKSMIDVEAAVEFLDEDARSANNYGIDPNFIFIGGVSAGSIATSNYAMLDATDSIGEELRVALENNDEINGISNTEPRVHIAGLINFSGALRNADFIDAGDPPMISFHDDEDPVVPYRHREIEVIGVKIASVDGSFLMDSAAVSVGLKSELHSFENSPLHLSYFDELSTTEDVLNITSIFMHDIVCEGFASTNNLERVSNISAYPNPMSDFFTIDGLIGNETISIRSVRGEKIDYYIKNDLKESCILNVKDLLPGIYIMMIQRESAIQTYRVIKL